MIHEVSNILTVQKQRLGLGQITIRAVSQSNQFVAKESVPECALKEKRFHEHYCPDRYNGIEDWFITLIGSANTSKELRRKELHWMYKVKTYAPYGLNESNVYETF